MDPAEVVRAAERLRRTSVLGVFTLAMANEAGFTRGSVRHRVSRGRWHRLVGAAYVDVTAPVPPVSDAHRRAAGAALTWPSAVVCLRTAAVVHGLPVRDDGQVHVVVRGRRRVWAGLVPHFLELGPRDARRVLSFQATTPLRTALDCLATFPYSEAENLLAWVRTREVVTVDVLAAAVAERGGRPGVAQLRRLLAATAGGALSEGERRLHRLLDVAGLIGWEADQRIVVNGRVIARADVLFRAERLILEVDGRRAHPDFEADRARLNALTVAGYTVLRFTWRQLVDHPATVRGQIETALDRARGTTARPG